MRGDFRMLTPVSQRLWGVLLLAGAVVTSACAGGQRQSREPGPVGAGETGMVGGIQIVRDPALTGGGKVIVASFRFTAAGVEPREAIVAFGATNTPRTDTTEFTFQLLGAQDRVLAQFGTLDPRKVVVERQGVVQQPEAIYAARFPFNPGARSLRVLNSQRAEVARTELTAVIREFCTPLRQDRECSEALRESAR
jgi:hypothetical protein